MVAVHSAAARIENALLTLSAFFCFALLPELALPLHKVETFESCVYDLHQNRDIGYDREKKRDTECVGRVHCYR